MKLIIIIIESIVKDKSNLYERTRNKNDNHKMFYPGKEWTHRVSREVTTDGVSWDNVIMPVGSCRHGCRARTVCRLQSRCSSGGCGDLRGVVRGPLPSQANKCLPARRTQQVSIGEAGRGGQGRRQAQRPKRVTISRAPLSTCRHSYANPILPESPLGLRAHSLLNSLLF